MQTPSKQPAEIHQTVQQLKTILEAIEARHERAMHRYRMLWPGSMLLVVAALYMVIGSGSTAIAQT